MPTAPAPAPPRAFLTVQQLAAVMAVHPASIRRYLERGWLRGVKTPGGEWRIDPGSLDGTVAHRAAAVPRSRLGRPATRGFGAATVRPVNAAGV